MSERATRKATMQQHQRGMNERLLTLAVRQLWDDLTRHGCADEDAARLVRDRVEAALRDRALGAAQGERTA